MPPMGPGLPPARDDAERALHAEIAAGTAQMFAAGLPALNAARAALGLAPLADVLDQLRAADVCCSARAAPSTPPRDPAAPCAPTSARSSASRTRAARRHPALPDADPRPLVAVAFSTSFQNHAGVLQAVIDALATLPVRGLVTLAGIAPTEVRGADNVTLVDHLPHDALMREACLVVTHGGHGTVMRALSPPPPAAGDPARPRPERQRDPRRRAGAPASSCRRPRVATRSRTRCAGCSQTSFTRAAADARRGCGGGGGAGDAGGRAAGGACGAVPGAHAGTCRSLTNREPGSSVPIRTSCVPAKERVRNRGRRFGPPRAPQSDPPRGGGSNTSVRVSEDPRSAPLWPMDPSLSRL